MTEIVLTGMDGMNPLGYLASLGVLRIAEEKGLSPRLRWEFQAAWYPIIDLDSDRDGLVAAIESDLADWREAAPELELSYLHNSKRIYELKPPPGEFQAFARDALDAAILGDRRWADHVASYAAAHEKLGCDGKGEKTKPTALHFSAGQQRLLTAVRAICAALAPEDFQEAMFGPWEYRRELPVLGWDVVSGERDYALRAVDPSGDKKTGVPGADWLAFRGLPFYPVVLRRGAATTTGFSGSGKRYRFHWALWAAAMSAGAVRSVAATRWDQVSALDRKSRGIEIVLCARVRRTDQGGYGSFSAASVQ